MVGVLVAAAGVLGVAGYELLSTKKAFRREPVWKKLDNKSMAKFSSRGRTGQVACGPNEVESGALPQELTPRSFMQTVAQSEPAEEYPHDHWDLSNYYWVVICKNRHFHHKQNPSYQHKIPLAETDAFEELPALTRNLVVHCNECGKDYSYRPDEVLRYELSTPEPFTPHPMFK